MCCYAAVGDGDGKWMTGMANAIHPRPIFIPIYWYTFSLYHRELTSHCHQTLKKDGGKRM